MCDVGQVMACREALARAAHQHQADALGLVGDLLHMAPQLLEHRHRQRVELVRAVQGQDGKAFAVFP